MHSMTCPSRKELDDAIGSCPSADAAEKDRLKELALGMNPSQAAELYRVLIDEKAITEEMERRREDGLLILDEITKPIVIPDF